MLLASLVMPIKRLPTVLKAGFIPILLMVLWQFYGIDLVAKSPIGKSDFLGLALHAGKWFTSGLFLFVWLRAINRNEGGDWPLVPFLSLYAILYFLYQLFQWLAREGFTTILRQMPIETQLQFSDWTVQLPFALFASALAVIPYIIYFRLSLGLSKIASGEHCSINESWELGSVAPVALSLLAAGIYFIDLGLNGLFLLPVMLFFPEVTGIYFDGMYDWIKAYHFIEVVYIQAVFAAALFLFLRGNED
ncbi:hypothetical protein [Aestuariispira insulae]|uniref:Uncharacterized protein n=1 Tax=Aestuariispira insulae TaxID=1461337 RepID=A0A3D9HPX2_9PROT|nr:hypothetical protein [Aestuariispira insulae]RED51455.1 hypothetical protein DFP90_103256 [Aestuariispira insulae]